MSMDDTSNSSTDVETTHESPSEETKEETQQPETPASGKVKKKRQFRWTEKNRAAFEKCKEARRKSLALKKAAKEGGKVEPASVSVGSN